MDDDVVPLPDPHSGESPTREAHFDEMNIVLTYHPHDKDYGHTKIDEPKTPYNYCSDSETEEGTSEGVRRVSISDQICVEFDPEEISEKVYRKRLEAPKLIASDVDTDDDELTPEQKERRHQFDMKRRKHYNEFQAVKLAKQLLAAEEDDNDEAENAAQQSVAGCSSSTAPMAPVCASKFQLAPTEGADSADKLDTAKSGSNAARTNISIANNAIGESTEAMEFR